MSGRGLRFLILLGGVALTATGCATSPPPPPPPPSPPPASAPKPVIVRQSDDFLVVVPDAPETSASLAQQMRYLKTEGYRPVTMVEFLEFTRRGRQLPKRSVVLTFDDGYKSFKLFAYPVLKELGFAATLFVYTDYVGTGRNALSWQELKDLQAEGFDVQAHSKTHSDLRRAPGETSAQFERRMQTELALPRDMFKRQLGQMPDTLAYPYGRWDTEVLKQVKASGYLAAFTVRRQANPSFVSPLTIHRSQVYADMTLEDFAKNLTVFQEEDLR